MNCYSFVTGFKDFARWKLADFFLALTSLTSVLIELSFTIDSGLCVASLSDVMSSSYVTQFFCFQDTEKKNARKHVWWPRWSRHGNAFFFFFVFSINKPSSGLADFCVFPSKEAQKLVPRMMRAFSIICVDLRREAQ